LTVNACDVPLGAPEIHSPQVGQRRPVEWAISVGDGH
jgi:hypothetical protein